MSDSKWIHNRSNVGEYWIRGCRTWLRRNCHRLWHSCLFEDNFFLSQSIGRIRWGTSSTNRKPKEGIIGARGQHLVSDSQLELKFNLL